MKIKCPFCDETFDLEVLMSSHIIQDHESEIKQTVRKYCDLLFKIHEKSEYSDTCPECGDTTQKELKSLLENDKK